MKKAAVITWSALAMVGAAMACAGELPFPQTAEEIVEALSLKDGRTMFQGREYVVEDGIVYEVIGGKRYRLRGLDKIVDSELAPRAGAMIHFDLNSANIKHESFGLLDEYGKALKGGLAGTVLQVQGHTDSQGPDKYNQVLSERRAQAVVGYLTQQHGISGDRLAVRAYGETRPIALNDTTEGRAKNRRVEFVRVE